MSVINITNHDKNFVAFFDEYTVAFGSAGVQVSEEAPSFATDSKFGDLLVVVVPHQVGLVIITKYKSRSIK